MAQLHDLFDASAHRVPHSDALRYRGKSFSYREIHERTLAIAAGLERLGVRRRDRVVLHLQNRPETVEFALACSRVGAIFVPANPMLKARQLAHILNDCGAKVLCGSLSSAVSLAQLSASCPEFATFVHCDGAGAQSKIPEGLAYAAYEDLAASSATPGPCPAIDEDPAALLYTSGSTGRPKGVIVSHRNLVAGAWSVSRYLKNNAADRICAALPLSFDYGFSQVSTAFAVGACAVLSGFALPAALLQEIASEHITGLAGVPTMWMHLAASEWPAGVAERLAYITNSGGPLPTPVLRTLQQRLPRTRIYCMYGLTEAFRSTYLEPDMIHSRPGSIGKAIPDQEILVLREDGGPCRPGEVGELVHRGSLVTLGYWNDPEQTKERYRPLPKQLPAVPRDEIAVWSGDLVKTDEDGYLYFVGRKDHLIKTSGHRVSPTEIEEVVMDAPGVLEAAVVGLPDEVLGQRIVVAVVAKPDGRADLLDAIGRLCRMHLAPYMTPSEFHLLEAIPRNANGKADRFALIQLLSNAQQRPAST